MSDDLQCRLDAHQCRILGEIDTELAGDTELAALAASLAGPRAARTEPGPVPLVVLGLIAMLAGAVIVVSSVAAGIAATVAGAVLTVGGIGSAVARRRT